MNYPAALRRGNSILNIMTLPEGTQQPGKINDSFRTPLIPITIGTTGKATRNSDHKGRKGMREESLSRSSNISDIFPFIFSFPAFCQLTEFRFTFTTNLNHALDAEIVSPAHLFFVLLFRNCSTLQQFA